MQSGTQGINLSMHLHYFTLFKSLPKIINILIPSAANYYYSYNQIPLNIETLVIKVIPFFCLLSKIHILYIFKSLGCIKCCIYILCI